MASETFGDRLATLRHQSGLSQSELGQRLSFTGSAISFWERSERIPPATTLVLIADSFGVSLDWLVMGRGQHEGRVLIGAA